MMIDHYACLIVFVLSLFRHVIDIIKNPFHMTDLYYPLVLFLDGTEAHGPRPLNGRQEDLMNTILHHLPICASWELRG